MLCVLGTEKITINLEISFFLFRKKKRRLEFFPYTFFPPIGFLKRNEKKKRNEIPFIDLPQRPPLPLRSLKPIGR